MSQGFQAAPQQRRDRRDRLAEVVGDLLERLAAAVLEDDDLAAYAAKLGLDQTRLIREVIWKIYTQRIREDFKSGVRGGVNGTPTFFINGERYDGIPDLKHLLNALTPQSA